MDISRVDNTEQIFQSTSKSNKTALIVDDDIDARLSLSFLITRSNFDVLFADNGIDASELYIEHNPDVVFMDFRMPDMDGIDASKKIHQFNPLANIVIITGDPNNPSLLELIADKHIQLLEKPVNYIDIVNILNTVNLK